MRTTIRVKDSGYAEDGGVEMIVVGTIAERSEWIGFNIHDGLLTIYGLPQGPGPAHTRMIRSIPLTEVVDITTENALIPEPS